MSINFLQLRSFQMKILGKAEFFITNAYQNGISPLGMNTK